MFLLHEPDRTIPVCHKADLCIVGGSCIGVFAARLGLSVALIEQNTLFGGMATVAQVNEWHSVIAIHCVAQRDDLLIGCWLYVGPTLAPCSRSVLRSSPEDSLRGAMLERDASAAAVPAASPMAMACDCTR